MNREAPLLDVKHYIVPLNLVLTPTTEGLLLETHHKKKRALLEGMLHLTRKSTLEHPCFKSNTDNVPLVPGVKWQIGMLKSVHDF